MIHHHSSYDITMVWWRESIEKKNKSDLLEQRMNYMIVSNLSDSCKRAEVRGVTARTRPLHDNSSLSTTLRHFKWHPLQFTNGMVASAWGNWHKLLHTESSLEQTRKAKWTKPFLSAIGCQMTRWMLGLEPEPACCFQAGRGRAR